jgi:hypothetical protein
MELPLQGQLGNEPIEVGRVLAVLTATKDKTAPQQRATTDAQVTSAAPHDNSSYK